MTEEVQNPEAVLAELRRAQADLKELRATFKALETERDGLKSQVESLNSDEMRVRALKAEVKLALQGQGIKDADRLMPYIGTEGIDFGEDGAVVGLNERLDSLKKDLPEVFDPKVRAGGKADIFANDSVEKKMTSTEAQVARLFAH
jgi:hypothetical protein